MKVAISRSPADWLWLLPDHALPGAFFMLVTAAYAMALPGFWRGEGAASGLDPIAHASLLFQRSASLVFYGLIAFLFMFRRARVGPHSGLGPALVALAGAWGLGGLAVQPFLGPLSAPVGGSWVVGSPAQTLFTAAGGVVIAIGAVLGIVSLAYLGRCFGVFPEARGLVTRGPYRYVRHPLYLAEILGGVGSTVTALSLASVASLALFVVFQYLRAIYEERALSAAFPEYTEYAQRTWRLLPGVH